MFEIPPSRRAFQRSKFIAGGILSVGVALGMLSNTRAASFSWDQTGGGALGGTGTWDTTSTNWWNGTSDVAWSDTTGTTDIATFAGTAGTVTLGTNLGALGLIFGTTGYTVALGGNTLSLGTSGIDASNLTSGTTTISGTGGVSLGGAQSWTVGTGATLAVSSVIGGSGPLTKAGAGTLTLTGANTYSGGTTLSAGTLLIQGSSTPTAAGSTVTSGPLGTGTLTLNGGTFGFATGASSTVANNVSVGGATNLEVASGTNEVLNGNWSGSGNLTLVQNGSTGQWQFGGDNSGYTGTFTQNTGTTSLAFNSASAGSANAAWVFNNAQNQRTRLNFGTGTVNFGSISGTGSIANVAGSGTSTMSVGALNTSTTYSGIIGGSTAGQGQNIALVKVGTGTLTLSGANTYTAGTTVSAGTVKIGNATALGGNAGAVSVANGAALDLNGTTMTGTNALTLNGTGISAGGALTNSSATAATYAGLVSLGSDSSIVASSGKITLSNTGTITGSGFGLTLDGTASGSTIASIIGTGTGSVTKQGAGTWTLSAANTYSGGTTINAGTLILGNAASLGSTSGALTVGGGTLNASTFSPTVGAVTLSSGSITGSGILTGSSFALQSGSVSTGLAGSGSTLTKSTAGTVTLSGANTYTGATNVNAGTLLFSGAASTVGSLAVADGANLQLKSFSPSSSVLSGSSLTLGSSTGSTLTVDFNSLANPSVAPLSLSGGFTITGATLAGTGAGGLTNTNGTPFTLVSAAGGVTGTFANSTVTLGARSTGTIGYTSTAVTLDITTDSITWSGASNSTWTTGTNGVVGPNPNWATTSGHAATDFWAGDIVRFSDTYNIGSGDTPVTNSAVSISGGNVSPASVTFNNSAVDYTISTSDSSGIAGSGALTKNGTGKVTISTANTYSGGTTLNSGTLVINNAAAIGTGALTIAGGTLDNTSGAAITLSNNNTQNWNGSFAFTGTNDLNLGTGAVALGVSPTVTVNGGTLTVGGAIGGGFGLTKAGAGTLALTGASTYSGGTTLNAGTLLVQGSSTPTSGTVASGPLGTGTLTLNGGTFGFVAGASYTIANNVSVTGATNIEVATGTNEVLNGNWSGSGNLTLLQNGAVGQWQFGGDNSGYTGTFTQNGGNTSLAFNSASAGSAGAAWVFNNNLNQRTRLNFGAGTINFGSLAGNGSIANVAGSGKSTVSVGALNSSTTFSGILGGSSPGQGQNIALVKVGTGVLTLSGANTYTGGTMIDGGTLRVNGSLATTDALDFAGTGSTLAGAGTVGAVTLESGNFLAPGNGTTAIGTLTANSLTLNGGDFVFDLSSSDNTSDLIVVTGALTDGGTAYTFDFSGGAAGQTYTLLTFGSTNFADASKFSSTGVSGTFALNSGSLTFTAVPEPGVVALLTVGLGSVMFAARRKRRMA
jgi:autotransporter-associated beta strand protein